MNDGMRSSGLVCISTNTFSVVDIFIYKMFTFRSPDRGASSEHSYFFAKNNISYQQEYDITIHRLLYYNYVINKKINTCIMTA